MIVVDVSFFFFVLKIAVRISARTAAMPISNSIDIINYLLIYEKIRTFCIDLVPAIKTAIKRSKESLRCRVLIVYSRAIILLYRYIILAE